LASVGWGRREQLRIQPGIGTRTLESVYICIAINNHGLHIDAFSREWYHLGGNSTKSCTSNLSSTTWYMYVTSMQDLAM
jgi:hypothetical protein